MVRIKRIPTRNFAIKTCIPRVLPKETKVPKQRPIHLIRVNKDSKRYILRQKQKIQSLEEQNTKLLARIEALKDDFWGHLDCINDRFAQEIEETKQLFRYPESSCSDPESQSDVELVSSDNEDNI